MGGQKQGPWWLMKNKFLLPQSIQWKAIKTLHDAFHVGRDTTLALVSRIFTGQGLAQMIRQVCRARTLCVYHNPGPKIPSLLERVQRRGSYPREGWQIDFTHMPTRKGFKYLLVLIDTFTGWTEACVTRTDKATEVIQFLLNEIIPRFGLPCSLQSDNGPSFTSHITQGVSKALGIRYYLHSAWRPQSSGKVERTNQTLKCTLGKLRQKTSGTWISMLPIALMRIRNTPRAKINFSPYEMLYGRPFLSGDMLSDPETANLIKYFTNLGQFQIALREYGNNILPMPGSHAHLSKIKQGNQVLIKTCKEGSSADQLQPKWKDPFSVILTTPSAI